MSKTNINKSTLRPHQPVGKRKLKGATNDETKFLESAVKGKVERIEKFLKKGGDINCRDINDGDSALHLASEAGQVRFLAEVLKHKPNVNVQTPSYETPLHRATAFGHVDIVMLLLKAGADMLAADKTEVSPIGLAISIPQDDVFMAMIDHIVDINVINSKGNGLLHEAAIHDNKKAILSLLKKGANIDLPNKTGNTACHLAALNGSSGALVVLLGFSPNIRLENKSAMTPASCAFHSGHFDLAKILNEKMEQLASAGVSRIASEDDLKRATFHLGMPGASGGQSILYQEATKEEEILKEKRATLSGSIPTSSDRMREAAASAARGSESIISPTRSRELSGLPPVISSPELPPIASSPPSSGSFLRLNKPPTPLVAPSISPDELPPPPPLDEPSVFPVRAPVSRTISGAALRTASPPPQRIVSPIKATSPPPQRYVSPTPKRRDELVNLPPPPVPIDIPPPPPDEDYEPPIVKAPQLQGKGSFKQPKIAFGAIPAPLDLPPPISGEISIPPPLVGLPPVSNLPPPLAFADLPPTLPSHLPPPISDVPDLPPVLPPPISLDLPINLPPPLSVETTPVRPTASFDLLSYGKSK